MRRAAQTTTSGSQLHFSRSFRLSRAAREEASIPKGFSLDPNHRRARSLRLEGTKHLSNLPLSNRILHESGVLTTYGSSDDCSLIFLRDMAPDHNGHVAEGGDGAIETFAEHKAKHGQSTRYSRTKKRGRLQQFRETRRVKQADEVASIATVEPEEPKQETPKKEEKPTRPIPGFAAPKRTPKVRQGTMGPDGQMPVAPTRFYPVPEHLGFPIFARSEPPRFPEVDFDAAGTSFIPHPKVMSRLLQFGCDKWYPEFEEEQPFYSPYGVLYTEEEMKEHRSKRAAGWKQN